MTDQETATTDAPAAEPGTPRASAARVLIIVAGAGALLGALGGWLWYVWWGPPNKGSIYDTAAYGITWLDTSDQGIAHEFAGTGQYAVIGLVCGLVIGVLAALVGRQRAYAALAGILLAAALGAGLSWFVGTTLSPPDPQKYATEANVCTELPCKEYEAAIEVSGWTPYLVWPIGGLVAYSLMILAGSSAGEVRRQQQNQQQAGTWLQPGASGRSEP